MTKIKSPSTAALLNCIPLPLGVGYIYLGQWARFAIAFVGLQTLLPTFLSILGLRPLNRVAVVIAWIATIIDGYRQAQHINAAAQDPERYHYESIDDKLRKLPRGELVAGIAAVLIIVAFIFISLARAL